MQREGQAKDGGDQEQNAAPRERQHADQQITHDADGRHGDVVENRVGTVVHDAAIPVFVDGAWLSAGDVVNAQRQRGDESAGEGQKAMKYRMVIGVVGNPNFDSILADGALGCRGMPRRRLPTAGVAIR